MSPCRLVALLAHGDTGDEVSQFAGHHLVERGAIIVRNSFSRAALLGNSGGWILEAVRMDGLLGRNWIATRECIFYSSSSTLPPRLRSASSLISVMNFSNFCCDSVCSISIGSPIFPPPLRHCDRPHGSVPCKCQCFDCGSAVFHRLLHLLERTHVDLAHALAGDAEFGG